MINLHWPALLVLIPLPFLVRMMLQEKNSTSGAIKVPFYQILTALDSNVNSHVSFKIVSISLLWLAWTCLVIASARPSWIGDPITLPQDRRDLLLAVDISNSMREADMLINNQYVERVTAVKAVVGDFVQNRTGDRLGLILFGEQAYLQTPLTHDRETVKQQLQEAQPGFAGRATAIGDAIGLAIKRLRDRPTESRVLILLTDGANSAGSDPNQAATIAAEAGIRIHTVGVGAKSKKVRDRFGRIRDVNVRNQIDETSLQNIASTTGGQFFRAVDPRSLIEIYKKLDELEPKPQEQTFRQQKSLIHWPIAIAILLLVLVALIRRQALGR